jgi:L-alanine-DL-glutamate epimerase-like enolase superfamily enzyme
MRRSGEVLQITRARACLCNLVPPRRRDDAIQTFVRQETILVELETSDGLTGIGYAYTIGTGGRSVLDLLRHHLLDQVVGQDANEVEALWQRLLLATRATSVGVITSLALAAVDTAAWDLRCRALEVPLWKLAGGARRSVPLYDTEGGWLNVTADELVTAARASVDAGWQGIKLKVGKPDPHEDLDRLRAVRAAVGPSVDLMVDANQAFSRAEAKRRLRLFEEVDLYWFEEPIPAEDNSGHVALAESTTVPIAVGESIYSLSHLREYLERGAAGIAQPDVARIGGITPWLKAAHLAEAFNVKVAPHFLMELHVSLAAAVPNSLYVEYIPQLSAIVRSEIEIVEGHAIPPSLPGIGIDWDLDAVGALAQHDGCPW